MLDPACATSSFTYDCFCTQRGGRRAPQGERLQGDGLRRLLPRADRRAAGRVRGRGPRAGGPVPDARRLDHLDRPGPRRHHVRDPVRPRLRAQPRQRRPALHAGQPGRRRADGDHPRAAWRGPALQHAAPDRAVRRADRARDREVHARVRPPALRHGRGQQEALQARPAGAHARSTASRASCPRGCSTTSPCSAGRSPPTATSSPSRRWSQAFEIGDVNPNPARFDLKKADAINASHMRLLPLDEITERVLPFLRRPASSTRPTSPTASCSTRRCRSSPSGSTSSPRPSTMLDFLFVDEAAFARTRRARRRRARRREGGVRRAVGASTSGAPPPSTRRCAPSSSRSSG